MSLFFTKLPQRGLIHIEGEDRHSFLQNLISNDVEKLNSGKSVYACLLNAQGKFLHDFFLSDGKGKDKTDTGGFILIECEGGDRAKDLFRRLSMYRLRADVKLSLEEDAPVYAIWGESEDKAEMPATATPDPRHEKLGWRAFEKPDAKNAQERPFKDWDKHRIALCIPDGSRDLVIDKATLLESNIDKLNGISLDKGCYIGQEITARMHYRGLAKKHLYAISTNATTNAAPLPETGAQIRTQDGKMLGEMRSSCGDVGIALLRDDTVDILNEAGLEIIAE